MYEGLLQATPATQLGTLDMAKDRDKESSPFRMRAAISGPDDLQVAAAPYLEPVVPLRFDDVAAACARSWSYGHPHAFQAWAEARSVPVTQAMVAHDKLTTALMDELQEQGMLAQFRLTHSQTHVLCQYHMGLSGALFGARFDAAFKATDELVRPVRSQADMAQLHLRCIKAVPKAFERYHKQLPARPGSASAAGLQVLHSSRQGTAMHKAVNQPKATGTASHYAPDTPSHPAPDAPLANADSRLTAVSTAAPSDESTQADSVGTTPASVLSTGVCSLSTCAHPPTSSARKQRTSCSDAMLPTTQATVYAPGLVLCNAPPPPAARWGPVVPHRTMPVTLHAQPSHSRTSSSPCPKQPPDGLQPALSNSVPEWALVEPPPMPHNFPVAAVRVARHALAACRLNTSLEVWAEAWAHLCGGWQLRNIGGLRDAGQGGVGRGKELAGDCGAEEDDGPIKDQAIVRNRSRNSSSGSNVGTEAARSEGACEDSVVDVVGASSQVAGIFAAGCVLDMGLVELGLTAAMAAGEDDAQVAAWSLLMMWRQEVDKD